MFCLHFQLAPLQLGLLAAVERAGGLSDAFPPTLVPVPAPGAGGDLKGADRGVGDMGDGDLALDLPISWGPGALKWPAVGARVRQGLTLVHF
jgi:hypothetical protein